MSFRTLPEVFGGEGPLLEAGLVWAGKTSSTNNIRTWMWSFLMPKILWGCLCELIWSRSLGFNTWFSRNSDKFLLEAETLNLEQVEAESLWWRTWSISSLALSTQQPLWGTVWKYWSEDALWAHYLDSMNRLKYILIFVLTLPDSRVEISVILNSSSRFTDC